MDKEETRLLVLTDDKVVLPGGLARLTFHRTRDVRILARHVNGAQTSRHALLAIFPQFSDGKLNPVGTAARLVNALHVRRNAEAYCELVVVGTARCKLDPDDVDSVQSLQSVRVKLIKDTVPNTEQFRSLANKLKTEMAKLRQLLERHFPPISKFMSVLDNTPLAACADRFVSVIDAGFRDTTVVLNALDLEVRFEAALALLRQRNAQIRAALKGGRRTGHNPIEFRPELPAGKDTADSDDPDEDPDEGDLSAGRRLAELLAKADLPPEVRKGATRELRRIKAMEQTHNLGPEHHKACTYLETLLSLPWSIASQEDSVKTINGARKCLDDEHFGLDRVKQRIVEYTAVKMFHPGAKGQILCLVGPPGVGKTSLGRSIAHALGRKFFRISLGGIRDEADIRGFSRTYVGSQPGRIIQALQRVGTRDPVFLLDEVDKVSNVTGVSGNPGSALLEVLDPVQNASFVDRYVEYPFDLSQVIFIATANTIDTIPAPLLDRMEVIELSGYTLREKLEIARQHLVSKQLAEHGLDASHLVITDEILTMLAEQYTREAGVRELERKIGALCRGAVVFALEHKDDSQGAFTPTSADLVRLLGPPRHTANDDPAKRLRIPGVVIGLAANPLGGRVLFVEATKMKGTGKLELTGSLGDVIKESARISLAWIRSHYLVEHKPLGAGSVDLSALDIHIHFPEGAVGKDGPSAGVAVTVALVSLLTGRKARSDTAMTGEITLAGNVLPVGGIKAKVLAAHRQGIRRVLLPTANHKQNIGEIPAEIREQITLVPISSIRQALQEALVPAETTAVVAAKL